MSASLLERYGPWALVAGAGIFGKPGQDVAGEEF